MHSSLMRVALFSGLMPAVFTTHSDRQQPSYHSVIVSQTKAELTNFLNQHPPTSIGGLLATKVWVRLPDFEQVLTTAYQSADNHLSLNVILMTHATINSPDGHVVVFQKAMDSQNRIREILEATKPDIVGFEGDYSDRVNFQSLLAHIVDTNREFNRVIPMASAQGMLAQWTSHDGALQYLQSHPEAKLTGTEDQSLYALAMMLELNDRNNPLLPCLDRLRSELGLAKTILQLKRNNLFHGAVIPGTDHEADYRDILSHLPIQATFSYTVFTPVTTSALR